MTIDDAVNKTAMLVLFTSDGLDAAGIKEKKFYAKIVGRDSIGLWIENPKLETTCVRDDNGAIIPTALSVNPSATISNVGTHCTLMLPACTS